MGRSITLQPEDVNALLVAQFFLVAVLVAVLVALSHYQEARAAAFGGGVALLSAWLLGSRLRRASEVAKTAPGTEMSVLYIGAVVRFVTVLVLFVVGMGPLKLSPLALLGGFALAQVGFVINGVRVGARGRS